MSLYKRIDENKPEKYKYVDLEGGAGIMLVHAMYASAVFLEKNSVDEAVYYISIDKKDRYRKLTPTQK